MPIMDMLVVSKLVVGEYKVSIDKTWLLLHDS